MSRHLFIGALLVVVTLVVFAQVRGFPFINYDDTDYITRNEMVMQGLTGESIAWAFTARVSATWQPLTWLSFMADVQDGEADPARFHTTNLVLHVLNALLLYVLLVALTGEVWPAALVAALFAVHPLHVESVAWVAERKDVLSTFWGLVSLLAWTVWVRRGGAAWYAGAALALALGLMAKPMLVTWPFVMLLLDVWPLDRWGRVPRARLLREKVPFFVLAAASSVIAYGVQAGAGAVAATEVVGLGHRLVNAVHAYGAYLAQTFWPTGFSILYPHPYLVGGRPLTGGDVAFALVVLGAATGVVVALRARRWAPVGWLLFLGTLVPVSGLVQIGVHARADRFTYVPLIGIFIVVAWLLRDAGRALARRGALRHLPVAAGVAAVVACAVVAQGQAAKWGDQIALYESSLAAAPPGAPRIRYNLALALSQAGRHERAEPLYREVVRADPDHVKAWNNLGRTLALRQAYEQAEAAYREALRRDPSFAQARINYAVMLGALDRREEAIEQRLLALRDDPDDAANRNAVGSLLAMSGRLEEAREHFRRAVRLDPGNRQYRGNLRQAEQLLDRDGGS